MLLGKHYLFLFPSKTHKKFPSQLDKIGWFPSQLIKFISQPGIPGAFKSLDPKRPNKSDKTGTKQVFSASAITLTSRRMFVTILWEREEFLFYLFIYLFIFLVVLSLQSFYSQLGLKCQKKSVIPRENLYQQQNFPASSSKHLYFFQPARFLWGTDNVRKRFVGCPCHCSAMVEVLGK